MKKLYISDLDGTLLNTSAELSEFTKNAINEFTSRGGFFTIATARTSETVRHIMKGVNLSAPMILMTGVFALDPKTNKFIMSRHIDRAAVLGLIRISEKYKLSGFLYLDAEDHVETYYTRLCTEQSRSFKTEREQKYGKVFTKCTSFEDLDIDRTVYFSVCEERELLDEAAAELRRLDGLNINYFRDVYTDNLWYLDIGASNSSKRSALDYLRTEYGFDHITVFGDNYNDLPMFEAADTKIAVANAVPELKAEATEIICSNNEDGVAKYLLEQIEE